MIIPLAHEDLRGRRWPWVTIAIIALSTFIFLGTHNAMEREAQQIAQAQMHILLLSARYPDTRMTPDVRQIVDAYKHQNADAYKQLASSVPGQLPVDSWDTQFLAKNWTPAGADSEMVELSLKLQQARDNSIAWNYAFHPSHRTWKSYITANFLHAGWLDIIFNMWFLWLAGTVLEDIWGRIVYPIFYLACGALVFAIHAALFPGSLAPVLGASGAIAGLMGAFLARFPKTRVRLLFMVSLKPVRLFMPAYVIIPLWLLAQVFWRALSAALGMNAGVAYWADIGGFAFGALAALLLKYSGIEHSLDQAIEAKVSWTADPLIVRAEESLARNDPADAIASLHQLVAEKPDSIEGWEMLLAAQQREKGDQGQGQKDTLEALCRLHAASGEMAARMERLRPVHGPRRRRRSRAVSGSSSAAILKVKTTGKALRPSMSVSPKTTPGSAPPSQPSSPPLASASRISKSLNARRNSITPQPIRPFRIPISTLQSRKALSSARNPLPRRKPAATAAEITGAMLHRLFSFFSRERHANRPAPCALRVRRNTGTARCRFASRAITIVCPCPNPGRNGCHSEF